MIIGVFQAGQVNGRRDMGRLGTFLPEKKDSPLLIWAVVMKIGGDASLGELASKYDFLS
jgi:hypothetical protein